MAEYVLPSLGADMEAATVVEWLVKPGDPVKRGQVVGLVETEKAIMDIEFFGEGGVIEELLVPVGTKVAVGTPLARYQAKGEARAAAVAVATAAPEVEPAAAVRAAPMPVPEAAVPEAAPAAEAPAPAMPVPETPIHVAAVEPAHEPFAAARMTPAVRRLAHELHVDLAEVHVADASGRMTRADVLAAAGHGEAGAGLAAPVPAVAEYGEAGPPEAVPSEAAPPKATPGHLAAAAAVSPPPEAALVRRVRVSPRARRIAEEHGVDLAVIAGTGSDGEITAGDVDRVIAAGVAPAGSAPSPAPPSPAPASPAAPAATSAERAAQRQAAMREAIGALMARSKREIPHYYLATDIDLSRVMAWLQEQNERRPMTERLLPAALLIKAVALAIRDVPEMSGFWVDDHFERSDAVHVGVAISLRGGGLVAPAIHDTDQRTLDELMPILQDLVTRARSGVLHRAEMADPTITVTNLGDQGSDEVFGVIYPPQVALVGFGRITERAWAAGGMVGSRPIVRATLSADHRVSDGHRGGRFLAAIERRLQEPEKL